MRKAFIIIGLLEMLLLTAGTAAAQDIAEKKGSWSGRVFLSAGYGSPMQIEEEDGTTRDTLGHLRNQFAARVAYTTPKLTWSTDVQSLFERNHTENMRVAIKDDDNYEMNVQKAEFRRPSASWRSDLRWQPTEKRLYQAFVSYQYNQEHKDAGNVEAFTKFDNESRVFFSNEDRFEHRHGVTAGFRSNRQLGSQRRMLMFSADWRGRFQTVNSDWVKISDRYTSEILEQSTYTYRLTPRANTYEGIVDLSYRDSVLTGPHRLMLEPGVRVRAQETRDYNSGAVLDENETWRDSVRLRENFDFVQLFVMPHLRAEYRHRYFRAAADYTLQFYGHQLTNEMHYQGLTWSRPVVTGRSVAEWNVSSYNQLVLGTSIAVTHPEFRQICWFDRQGSEPSQLFRGNPDLLSSQNVSADLAWLLRYKRFRLTARSTFSRRMNELEQTFFEETIGAQKYRIFTWFNTARAEVFTQEGVVGWNGSMFSSNLTVLYRQTKRDALIQGNSNKTHYTEIALDASFRPGLGWNFSANGFYRGEVKTFYSLLGVYYTLNARIEKQFKSVTLSLEGRDLLDTPVRSEFYSADGKNAWATEVHQHRRIFLLGFAWNF